MPEEFYYVNPFEPDPFSGMRTIVVTNASPGIVSVREGDKILFTERSSQTKAVLELDENWEVKLISTGKYYSYLVKSEHTEILIKLVDQNEFIYQFEYDSHQYEITPYKLFHQLKEVQNSAPLAVLIPTWKDKEINERRTCTIRCSKGLSPFLVMCLYIAKGSSSSYYPAPFRLPE
ncbi:MAG: hypothetical protein KF824_05045 [Fimbriimonadaceae bacterium]|nr:MAG: hypothetical protein KF824_05045 [Fimbriimonadaceae bacterium]